MNPALDHIFSRQGDPPGKPPVRRGPGWEIIVIAVSIALPLTVFCGRVIKQRIDDQAALATQEPEQPRRRPASQVHVVPAGEDKPRPPQDATARNESSPGAAPESDAVVSDRVARPESSIGVAGAPQRPDTPAGLLNSVPRATQKSTPATPFAKPRGVPPNRNLSSVATRTAPASNPRAATPQVAPGPSGSATAVRANPTPLRTQPDVASHGHDVASHQHDEDGEFDDDGNVRMAGRVDDRMSEPASPIQAVPAQAAAVSLDLDLENALANAWGLIERGDHDLGRRVLLEAGKRNRDDIRIDFSLGLLDALLDHNWPSAEKHFAECARREPQNTASLNNLALTRLRLAWDKNSLKPWEAILSQDAVPPEVLQNLGRVRHVLQGGRVPSSPALAEAVDRLYLKVSITTGKSSQPRTGFLFMGLTLADGRTVGWSEAKKYEDTWCVVCQGSGQARCPNPACVRGMVKVPKLQGGGRTPCQQCRGNGGITCNACSRGRDRGIAWSPSSPVRGPVTPATTPASSPAAPPPAGAAPPVTPRRTPMVQPAPLAPGLER